MKKKKKGSFGVIGLRAAQDNSMVEVNGVLEPSNASFVQLRYSFFEHGTNEPLIIPRTHMTFYDFDQGMKGQTECMQLQASDQTESLSVDLSENTELEITLPYEGAPPARFAWGVSPTTWPLNREYALTNTSAWPTPRPTF